MLATSEAYQDAVVQSTRSSVASIYFGVYDIIAKSDATPSATSSQPFVNINNLVDNILIPGFNIASFEDDYFRLDESMYLVPDDVNSTDVLGWWSLLQSDASGVFSPVPTITIVFGGNHSTLGIGLCFDSVGGSYCTSFDVTWYSGTTQLDYISVTNNTSTEYNATHTVNNFNKIVIKLYNTDKPYRYARLMEVNFGINEVFDSNNITKASIIEEVDPINNTLTMNKLTFTVLNQDQRFNMVNPNGVYAYLQKRQPLIAKSGLLLPSGIIEYVAMGTYYLSDWKNTTGITATLEATDVIGLLDKTTYYASSFWVNATLETVVSAILLDAGTFLHSISSELSSEVINGYLPIMSHREALQCVFMAARATVRYNRDGSLFIFRPDYVGLEKSVSYDEVIGAPQIAQKSLITSVQATDYSYAVDSVVTQLYQSTFTLNGTQTYVIPYDKAASNVSAVVTGSGSISGSPVYGAVSVKLTIIGTGSLTLTVSGKAYIENNRLTTVTASLVSGEVPQVATIADNKLFSGNTINVCQYLLDYYTHRIKQTLTFWDDPSLQSGDAVGVENMFGTTSNGIIEQQEITFAPNLRAKMEVTG